MERKIIIMCLAILTAAPAFAELTVDDVASRDYLRNHGYSTANINVVRKSIARVNGEPLEEPVEYKYYKNPCAKFFRRIWMYLDPAYDDHTFGTDYEIKPTTRFDEL